MKLILDANDIKQGENNWKFLQRRRKVPQAAWNVEDCSNGFCQAGVQILSNSAAHHGMLKVRNNSITGHNTQLHATSEATST